jgi:putative acetyltransferase
MLIRSEAPADLLAIDTLLKDTFLTNDAARLVMSLRENGHNTLSLVACNDEGELIGHLMFSPVNVNEKDTGVQALAPLCVHPDYQGQEIENQLVEEGLAILTELGYPACVVLGDSYFYRDFGFLDADVFELHCNRQIPQACFMAIALNEVGFSGEKGLVTYCPEFNLPTVF